MKNDSSLTLDEVDQLVNHLGGVEVCRAILRNSVKKTLVQDSAKQVSVPEVKVQRNPKTISTVLEVCGLIQNTEAAGFIVRCALLELHKCLGKKQKEVFLSREFFKLKFEEQKPAFGWMRVMNAFTPGQGVGLTALQNKIVEFGYELHRDRQGLVIQQSDWNNLV